MDANIEIRYSTLPFEIFEDLAENFQKTELTVQVIKEEEYYNFTGGPADLIVYIGKHFEEFIIGGVVFDILKLSIKGAWKKLVRYYRKTNEEIEEDKNLIELNFELRQDGTVEFSLIGDIDEESIDNAVDKIFEYLNNRPKVDEDIKTQNLIDANYSKPRIRMVYDTKSKTWTPINFTEMAKQYEEWLRQANQDFDS